MSFQGSFLGISLASEVTPLSFHSTRILSGILWRDNLGCCRTFPLWDIIAQVNNIHAILIRTIKQILVSILVVWISYQQLLFLMCFLTSVSKNLGQSAVVYYYCALSQFFFETDVNSVQTPRIASFFKIKSVPV